jgi:hypothetical protein
VVEKPRQIAIILTTEDVKLDDISARKMEMSENPISRCTHEFKKGN